jgi:hypothetical protein
MRQVTTLSFHHFSPFFWVVSIYSDLEPFHLEKSRQHCCEKTHPLSARNVPQIQKINSDVRHRSILLCKSKDLDWIVNTSEKSLQIFAHESGISPQKLNCAFSNFHRHVTDDLLSENFAQFL